MARRAVRRVLGLLAVCAVTSCTSTPVADGKCGQPLRAEPGELRTVLAGSRFGPGALLGDVVALPDGSVLVGYDTNPDEAGDADDLAGEKREPGLVVMRPDGSCAPFDLPVVDGRRVAPGARPMAVDQEGRLYLMDDVSHLLLRGTPADGWKALATIPDLHQAWGASAVEVGSDGTVYVATGYAVATVSANGTLTTIAGTGSPFRYDKGDLPLPVAATSTALPEVRDLAAVPSGGLLLTTKSSVLQLEDGTLDLVADWRSTAADEGAIDRDSWLHGLAVLPSGDILVSDLPGKRILRIADGRSSIFLTADQYLSTSWSTPFTGDGRQLLLRTDGGQALALYGLPS